MTATIWKKIEQIAEKYDAGGEIVRHEYQVCRLARQLFDELQSIHHLQPYDRDILSYAALLHDIGLLKGPEGHHKKSRDFICQELIGILHPADICIVAAVARYHRKALPKKYHSDIVDLNREDIYRIMVLASLIRIADGLDYSHQEAVKGCTCTYSEKDIIIRCITSGSYMSEQMRAQKKSDLASTVFHRQVTVIVQNSSSP